jgi:tetratricopeptide (TPR) repeat protein
MRVACFVAALALSLASPMLASADDAGARPKPTKQEQAAAGKRFREGERLYARHDYRAAAVAFEEAYELAPHPDALLNAADARRKAGDLRLAAELCQRVLRDFPDGKAASDARQRLGDLTPKLGRIELNIKGDEKDLTIDDRPATPGEVFVDPGDHVVFATFDGERVERRVSVVAGARVTVLLEAPPKKAAEQPKPKEAPAPPPDAPKPLHMAAFFVGLGLTAVSGGLLIWSGVDTNAARGDFEKNPTRAGYEEGLDKELRTNVLIGVTAGLGVATGLIGIFATDWSGGAAAAGVETNAALRLDVGPGSVAVQGAF